MRFYANPDARTFPAQALSLSFGGESYRFCLLHLTLGEERVEVRPRSVPEHAHRLYHAVLYTDGTGSCTVCGQAVPYRPGTLVLTSPGEPHDFSPRDPGRARYDEITFSLPHERKRGEALEKNFAAALGGWSGMALAPVRSLHLTAAQTSRLRTALEDIYHRVSDKHETRDWEVVEAIMGFLGLLLRLHGTGEGKTEGATSAQRMRQYLEAHLTEGIPMEDLASLTGLRKETAIRLFKKAWGLPPVAWQHRRRIDTAAMLLTSTDLPCREIASRLGYVDLPHFTKMFRKVRGTKPTAFRAGR